MTKTNKKTLKETLKKTMNKMKKDGFKFSLLDFKRNEIDLSEFTDTEGNIDMDKLTKVRGPEPNIKIHVIHNEDYENMVQLAFHEGEYRIETNPGNTFFLEPAEFLNLKKLVNKIKTTKEGVIIWEEKEGKK